MSMIRINDLSFSYPTGIEAVFEHVSFQIDSNWRLGLIGRNGRGKTTLLYLLAENTRIRVPFKKAYPVLIFLIPLIQAAQRKK